MTETTKERIKDCVDSAYKEIVDVIEKHAKETGLEAQTALFLFRGRVINRLFVDFYVPCIVEVQKRDSVEIV